MLREFQDAAGTTWRVWDVYPTGSSSTQRASGDDPGNPTVVFPTRDLNAGWLCFESPMEKRRLAPIPPQWETCEPCDLEEFCGKAGYITRPTPSLDTGWRIEERP